MVNFNGTALVTTFVNASTVTAVIPAGDFTTAGSDAITVTTGSSTTPAQTFNVLAAPTVNGGVGSQHSQVTEVDFTFNSAVTAQPGAFTLTRQSDGASITSNTGDAITATTTDNIHYVLTFSGASPLVQNGSLADGVYVLNVNHTLVTLGASPGGAQLAADYNSPTSGASRIFRLFGDINGDGSVNGADFGAFSNALGATSSDPNFQAAFDFNGDGSINGTDFAQFSNRFGITL